ncbi:MAG: AAA-like domain-containing protein [Spirochaetota bacterium]
MQKFFNTAGPMILEDHYTIPPLQRWDFEEVLSLITQKRYFVLHAPRQTGKTSALLQLMHYLNKEGKYKTLYVNIETAQTAREDVDRGIRTVMSALAKQEGVSLQEDYIQQHWHEISEQNPSDQALNTLLALWAQNSEKPIVLLLDEVDALVGDTLISVLRQIRAGYGDRPRSFPHSIILCGVRDVRDYRIHSGKSNEIITGGSAFNIKAESLRLGNFSQSEIETLYSQHTEATGQEFVREIYPYVYELTGGQPWLINALAYEACFRMKENRDRSRTITKEIIEKAKENLILRRDTHIDQLLYKLSEERVQRVIEPILQNEGSTDGMKEEDVQYLIDLGLITRKTNKKVSIANTIYQEVIPREITSGLQYGIHQDNNWYIESNTGKLDFVKLLKAFQEFYRENSEHWLKGMQYREAGSQLLLQAFLQRIINGGGMIDREYGLGRRRTDLFIRWFYDTKDRSKIQKIVVECKLIHKSKEKTLAEGLQQTLDYKDKCAGEEAYLILFDKAENKSWQEKTYLENHFYQETEIIVLGM